MHGLENKFGSRDISPLESIVVSFCEPGSALAETKRFIREIEHKSQGKIDRFVPAGGRIVETGSKIFDNHQQQTETTTGSLYTLPIIDLD